MSSQLREHPPLQNAHRDVEPGVAAVSRRHLNDLAGVASRVGFDPRSISQVGECMRAAVGNGDVSGPKAGVVEGRQAVGLLERAQTTAVTVAEMGGGAVVP